jgi:hypothetical protein
MVRNGAPIKRTNLLAGLFHSPIQGVYFGWEVLICVRIRRGF